MCIKPGEIHLPFQAMDHQWSFLEALDPAICPAQFVLLKGGYGSGKSKAISFAVAQMAIQNPGLRGGLIGATFGRLSSDVMPGLFEVLDSAQPVPISYRWLPGIIGGTSKRSLLLGEGWLNSIVDVRSMDDPSSIKGVNWAWGAGDEISLWPRYLPKMTEPVWSIVESRLRVPGGTCRFAGACTPEGRANWTLDPGLFQTPPDDATKMARWEKRFRLIRARTRDNIFLPAHLEEGLRDRLDPQQILEKLEGIDAAGVGGAAYPYFEREKNVRAVEFDALRGPLVVGMDFNVNPMTAVLGQFFRGQFIVFDEIYLRHSNTRKMAKAIKERAKALGVLILDRIEVYPDASGRARRTSGPADFKVLISEGLVTIYYPREGNPRVSTRLHHVNGAFYHQRIWIHPRCHNLIRECLQTEIDDDGQIVKTHDLGQITDALGYPVAQLMPIYEPGLGVSFLRR